MISPKVFLLSLTVGFSLPAWAENRLPSLHSTTLAAESESGGETAATEDNGKLKEAVDKLAELGIVTDPAYWLENAGKGRTCEGGMVAELIIKAAQKFSPADNLEAAVKILQANGILQDKKSVEYWETKAVTGKKCPGRFVSLIIISIAGKL